MARGKLRFNRRLRREIKALLFDIMFTEKSFMDLQRDHRSVNKRDFFTNSDNFNIDIVENKMGNSRITQEDLDNLFENFLNSIERLEIEKK